MVAIGEDAEIVTAVPKAIANGDQAAIANGAGQTKRDFGVIPPTFLTLDFSPLKDGGKLKPDVSPAGILELEGGTTVQVRL